MKNKLTFLTFMLTILFSINVFGQLQRLSIVPQNSIKISTDNVGNLESICIDYYRDAPQKSNTVGQPPFDQVYSEQSPIIKINGVVTDRSFKSLVQSESPLLILEPTSHRNVQIRLNPFNLETDKIESLEIEFNKPTEIGNHKEDRDTKQAQTIFENWGSKISQEDFWTRAKCLEILSNNNKLKYATGNQLTISSKSLCDALYKSIDFNMFSGKTFKNLIDNNYLIIDDNANPTKECLDNLTMAFYYQQAIIEAKKMNSYSTDIKTLKEKSQKYIDEIQFQQLLYSYSTSLTENQITENQIIESANLKLKDKFYQTSNRLTDISKENKSIKDTIIGGSRYVLMLAWKTSNSFQKFVKQNSNSLPTYESYKEFFTNPLFLTTKYDIEQALYKELPIPQTESQCELRLKQLLGLPPNSTNDKFYEFWVKEDDIFRPSIDSSLKSTSLLFKLSMDYIRKYAAFSNQSYQSESIFSQFPFTGLGYTWNYSPKSKDHFGVTEFVLKENRTIFIRGTVNTLEYIKTIGH